MNRRASVRKAAGVRFLQRRNQLFEAGGVLHWRDVVGDHPRRFIGGLAELGIAEISRWRAGLLRGQQVAQASSRKSAFRFPQ